MSLTGVPLVVILTTTTLLLTTPVRSGTTTTPAPATPTCEVDITDQYTLSLQQGETKSRRDTLGKKFTMYRCDNATIDQVTSEEFDCVQECLKEVEKEEVNGNYTCVACHIIYDTKEEEGDCDDDSNSAEGCDDFDRCYNEPSFMLSNCCDWCEENTPAESNEGSD